MLLLLLPPALLLLLVLAYAGPRAAGAPHLLFRAARTTLFAAAALYGGLTLLGLAGHSVQPVALGNPALGLGFSLDRLSGPFLTLASFIGAILAGYSETHLAGEARAGHFASFLTLTTGLVLLLIGAPGLLQFALLWIATSLSLDQLLRYYGNRPGANRAAAKKFVYSRIGDAILLLAAWAIWRQFGTIAFADFAHLASASGTSLFLPVSLLAVAALIKCAQFPFHGWLPDVLETPTPVSALLHAGIINAGGILMLRCAHLLVLSPGGMALLAVAGAASSLLASLAQTTQTSVKLQLAWSTIAQMGFMLIQCGLGIFSAAGLHILAHALYKAHAFLGAGAALESEPMRYRPRLLILLIPPLAIGAALAGAALASLPAHAVPGLVALAAILLMGALERAASRLGYRAAGLPMLAAETIALTSLYFVLQAAARALFGAGLPPAPASTVAVPVAIAVVAGFSALVVLPTLLRRAGDHPVARHLHIVFRHGFYFDTIADRLLFGRRSATALGDAQ